MIMTPKHVSKAGGICATLTFDLPTEMSFYAEYQR